MLLDREIIFHFWYLNWLHHCYWNLFLSHYNAAVESHAFDPCIDFVNTNACLLCVAPQHENPWTIPNFLCVCRIVLAPFLGHLIIQQHFHLSLALFMLAGATDLVRTPLLLISVQSQENLLGGFLTHWLFLDTAGWLHCQDLAHAEVCPGQRSWPTGW